MSPVCAVTRRLQCPRFNMRFNMRCETCSLNCSRMVTLLCAGRGAPMSCSSLLSGVRCPRTCDRFASSCCCGLELLWAGGDVSSSNASGPMLSNVTHTHTHAQNATSQTRRRLARRCSKARAVCPLHNALHVCVAEQLCSMRTVVIWCSVSSQVGAV
jgi:hypothetical protein